MRKILLLIMCLGAASTATAQIDRATQWELDAQREQLRQQQNAIESQIQDQKRQMEEMRIQQQNEADRLRVEQEMWNKR
jgi:hypothetical protein